jgi:hypothetical protein
VGPGSDGLPAHTDSGVLLFELDQNAGPNEGALAATRFTVNHHQLLLN